MGISQSKKYSKSSSNNEIQLDFKKEIIAQLKILTNWSFEQIREVCLAFKRYSYESPYIPRFIFKKIMPFSDRISNDLFHFWAKGDNFVSFYEIVCGLVLTSYNTLRRKLQFLYLVFNFTHSQSIRLKNYLLMYQCMIFAYCRLTDQVFPSFLSVKKFLFEEYLTSESMEVLEANFQFRRLIQEIQINQITRDLFMRFQGNVLGALEKPSTLMVNGLAKYNKQQSEKIFKTISNVYENRNYEDAENNQHRKKERLQARRENVIKKVEQHKEKQFQKTREFKIKNRSYSFKQLKSFNSKETYMSKFAQSNGSNQIHSSLQKERIVKSNINFQQELKYKLSSPSEKKIASFSTSLQEKSRKSREQKLSGDKPKLLSNPKPKNVVFLGGKAYTKVDFFKTIEYFNSLSNNKDEIKIKQFFKTFENKAFLKRQLFSLFKYIDKNSNGEISFEEFIKSTYPNIGKKFFQRLKEWNVDYKNLYQADKIFIKKENIESKIQLPEDAKLRITEIFVSFGGNKGYLTYEDFRSSYSSGFSMQECQNIVKEFGIDGKVYVQGFARMLLPQGFIIENCDWHLKKLHSSKAIQIQTDK